MNIGKDFKLFANDKGIPTTTLEDYQKKVFDPSRFSPQVMAGISNSAMHQYQSGISSNLVEVSGISQSAADIWNLTPNVVEERPGNMAILDVFSRLMKDRIIWFGTPVDSQVTNIVNAQLLFLENTDKSKEINMYIDSPGGSVIHGLSTVDVMTYINPDVRTTVAGMAASMGAILLASGTKGKRHSLKYSRTMIHQASGGAQGKRSDMKVTMAELEKYTEDLYKILAEATGKSYEQIEEDCITDKWFRAEEAEEYGIIDSVIKKKSEIK